MLWLKKVGFAFVSLDDAVSANSEHCTALRTAVTFDDGWYSTGAMLLPVMTELGIPSTLYLCTKHYVEPWPVLPVVLRYILWKSTQDDAEISGFDVEVDGYHVLKTPEQRNRLANKMFVSIEKFAFDKVTVEAALDRFAACLGLTRSETGFRSRAFSYMNADELRSASLNGCAIEMHGHVHQYPIGDPAQLRNDLEMCANIIDKLGLPKPKHYCYPGGELDGDAPAVLHDLGVISATTCFKGLVPESDKAQRYYLPRFIDGENVHMLEFQAELSGFSEIIRTCIGIWRQILRKCDAVVRRSSRMTKSASNELKSSRSLKGEN